MDYIEDYRLRDLDHQMTILLEEESRLDWRFSILMERTEEIKLELKMEE